jgi:CDP-paratose 2-epimerase
VKRALITGGAGFIGTNLAHRLLSLGVPVRIFDNLSRKGVGDNLRWLMDTHGELVDVRVADIRNTADVRAAVEGVDQVFHFAAQVAVTSSLEDPIADFQINTGGTLNLLEAIRRQNRPPGLIYTSTNKVYGALNDIGLVRTGTRYAPVNLLYRNGVSETRPLDFHSPYGCSKGAADQYVLDYARIYNIPAAVFRMSCIYGPHQFGTEDQGWVAHFLIRALENRPLTIYGDGAQIRDVLFIDDLVEAFLLAQNRLREISGCAFNIGGGSRNTLSLLELIRIVDDLSGSETSLSFEPWRPGDQRYYVSDYRSFQNAAGWEPVVGVAEGVRRLRDWLAHSAVAPAGAAAMQEVS